MDKDEERRKKIRMSVLYMTIPFALAVPPIVGWYLGMWLDKWLNTTPYLMFGLLMLGFIAGVREVYRIIKKYGNDGV